MPLPHVRSFLASLCLSLPIFAHPDHQEQLAAEMAQAANAFLAALNDEDRATATFPIGAPERTNWHYVPMADRGGLLFKSMNAKQRAFALRLLHTALSTEGSTKAVSIMQLEDILREIENGAPHRDPSLYTVAIFGEPGKNPWSWRFEGHHLSVNQTITDEGISGTPLFFGANPAKVPSGPKAGLSILADEEAMGRAFVHSLSPQQQQAAIIAARAQNEIETAQESRVSRLSPRGLRYAEMTPEQQTALRALVQLYIERHEDEIAAASLARIEANGFQNLVFAWAGPTEPGEGHYYRILGPTFVIEYGNTQNDANHHHTVFRDFDNDFGRDAFGDHYRKEH